MMGSTFRTFCTVIYSIARPAPFTSTLAGNVIASSSFFSETLALRATFKVVFFSEVYKGVCSIFPVSLYLIFLLFILFTCVAFMRIVSALNTVLAFAKRACKVFLAIVAECKSATRFRTPLESIFSVN
jgi:hypothetical protein